MIEHYIEEIKNIREELNWRVKIAYTSNLAIFPSLAALAGFLITKNIESENLYLITTSLSLIITMYGSLQIFNRMIEKKIEQYILTLQKKIYKKNNKKAIYSWISFLYGDNLHSNNIILMGYTSIFYQYFLPNIIGTIILLIPVFKHKIGELSIYFILFYVFCFILNLIVYGYIIMFLKYFNKVKRNHIDFFKRIKEDGF